MGLRVKKLDTPRPVRDLDLTSLHSNFYSLLPTSFNILPPAMSIPVTASTKVKSSSPVPLDTIPISPANENANPNMTSEEGAAQSGDEQVTVFHDPENFNVKHPLMHEWTLWFTKPPSGKVAPLHPSVHGFGQNTDVHKGDNWNDLLKEVVTFDSVEEFWGVYVSLPIHTCSYLQSSHCSLPPSSIQNNITPTSELALKSDYHLFKKGIRPEWEDPQNKHGGRFSLSPGCILG